MRREGKDVQTEVGAPEELLLLLLSPTVPLWCCVVMIPLGLRVPHGLLHIPTQFESRERNSLEARTQEGQFICEVTSGFKSEGVGRGERIREVNIDYVMKIAASGHEALNYEKSM